MQYRGIILAGGYGKRLSPLTKSISKHLMPIYDKPMIYYSLSTLMLAGLREILIIASPRDLPLYKDLLGDGRSFGIDIRYAIQEKPNGIVQSFLIGKEFLKGYSSVVILGDNLFHGQNFIKQLEESMHFNNGATLMVYPVIDPQNYGVIEFDEDYNIKSLYEKPNSFISEYAITGLYFYDESVVDKAQKVRPSIRGELEITDLNKMYLMEKKLKANIISRGFAWLDTGSIDSLHYASSYVRTLESRQGLKIGCPEEIAWRKGWIDDRQLESLAFNLLESGYGEYLLKLLQRRNKK